MITTRFGLRGVLVAAVVPVAFMAVISPSASASAVAWVSWSSFSTGNPGTAPGTIALPTPVNVGYSGEVLGTSYTGVGPAPLGTFTTWGGLAYVGGTVGNGPSNQGQIAVSGGPTTGTNTITFSPAVVNPVMAIWSLGSANTNPAEFVFSGSEPFTIQAGGADFTTGGQSITLGATSNIVKGVEGNGVIQFTGTYSSLTWTNPDFENDYAFTVGAVSNVPEPTLGLIALGGLSVLKRRRN